ncbi:MAG TPA: hypothetical protein EYP68_07415, partial [Candidatus Korarchaeota archaeon]|nr:hypothetical protein [Candidatus Korarchaeota archaeon]
GHMIIELPLSFLIALGLLETISNQNVRAFIGMTGGFVLIYLGANQIRKKDRISREDLPSVRTSFVAGALASGLNPYFIIWWLTVGAKLLSQSLLWMGWFGFLIVYILHVWMDYVWLIFVAHAFRMGKTLSERKYELLNGVLNSTVILLGIWFVFDAITLLKFS